MTYNFPKTIDSLKKYGIFAKKSLGQNFLLDDFITDQISASVNDIQNANILEIGPGPGSLTKSLLNFGAKKITVIEKDDRFIKVLEELSEISGNKIEIINDNALKIEEQNLMPNQKITIVANLPYNIGTTLLLKWLDKKIFSEMILMFQKEVVKRITAEPGSKHYGRLSILCNLLCRTDILMEVSPESFTPKPKVDSAIVRLVPRDEPLFNVNMENIENVTRVCFNQRRKTIANSMKNFNLEKEQIIKILEAAEIKPTARPEDVTIEQFCKLSKLILV